MHMKMVPHGKNFNNQILSERVRDKTCIIAQCVTKGAINNNNNNNNNNKK